MLSIFEFFFALIYAVVEGAAVTLYQVLGRHGLSQKTRKLSRPTSEGDASFESRSAQFIPPPSPPPIEPPKKLMAPRPRTSAAGVLALLSETEVELQQHALRSLSPLVPQFWAEISEYIAVM